MACRWVEPVLTAVLSFSEWTQGLKLRSPSLVGFGRLPLVNARPAAPAPGPQPGPHGERGEEGGPLARAVEQVEVEGRLLALSNLDKPLWPEDGVTKAH